MYVDPTCACACVPVNAACSPTVLVSPACVIVQCTASQSSLKHSLHFNHLDTMSLLTIGHTHRETGEMRWDPGGTLYAECRLMNIATQNWT